MRHWEGDTVIGRGNTGVLVTLVERCSRYTLVRCLPNREAAPVSAAIVEMLRPHKAQCLSLTFDNSKEFADHVFSGRCLEADVFFAHPPLITRGSEAPTRTPTGCCAISSQSA